LFIVFYFILDKFVPRLIVYLHVITNVLTDSLYLIWI
jgi:hypothetical protein